MRSTAASSLRSLDTPQRRRPRRRCTPEPDASSWPIAGDDEGSRQSADDLVDRLVTGLARFAGSGLRDGRGRHGRHEHHDPADLAYWAEVDAARGRLATALDIVVCTHYLGAPRRTYVVTVEGPARLLPALRSAAEAAPEAGRRALLTPAGPVTGEPTVSVLLVAAAPTMPPHRRACGGVPGAGVVDGRTARR